MLHRIASTCAVPGWPGLGEYPAFSCTTTMAGFVPVMTEPLFVTRLVTSIAV